MSTFVLALVLAQTPRGEPAPIDPPNVLAQRGGHVPAPALVSEHMERHAGWTHAAIGAHAVAQFADVSTTAWAMGRGGFREANPIMRPFAGDPIRLAVVKGAYAVGTSYLFLKMHKKRPKTAFALAVGSAVVTSIVAHKNAQLVRR